MNSTKNNDPNASIYNWLNLLGFTHGLPYLFRQTWIVHILRSKSEMPTKVFGMTARVFGSKLKISTRVFGKRLPKFLELRREFLEII